MEYNSLKDIYSDAEKFQADVMTQLHILSEEMAIWDENHRIHRAEARGEARGETKGKKRLNSLNSWLHSEGRDNDIWKALDDPEYQNKLLEEYNALNPDLSESTENPAKKS